MRVVGGRQWALALSCGFALVDGAAAQEVSAQVRQMCTPEARRLCPEHPLGTPEMRYCMEAKFKQINRDCVQALEDDGHLPRGSQQKQARR